MINALTFGPKQTPPQPPRNFQKKTLWFQVRLTPVQGTALVGLRHEGSMSPNSREFGPLRIARPKSHDSGYEEIAFPKIRHSVTRRACRNGGSFRSNIAIHAVRPKPYPSCNLTSGSSILIEIIPDLRQSQSLYRNFPGIRIFLKEIPAVDLRIVSQLRSVKWLDA